MLTNHRSPAPMKRIVCKFLAMVAGCPPAEVRAGTRAAEAGPQTGPAAAFPSPQF